MKASESRGVRSAVLLREISRPASTPKSRHAATMRNTVTQTSRVRSSVRGGAAEAAPLSALLDGTGQAEDRQVHRDEEAADHAAEEDHEDRLDHGGEACDGRVDFVVVEVGDLVEHLIHRAGRFTD